MKYDCKWYRTYRVHAVGRGVDRRKLRGVRVRVGLCLRGTLPCHAGMCSGASEGVTDSVGVVNKPKLFTMTPTNLNSLLAGPVQMFLTADDAAASARGRVPAAVGTHTQIPPEIALMDRYFLMSPSQVDPALVQAMKGIQASLVKISASCEAVEKTLSELNGAVQNLAPGRQTGPVVYACHKCATFRTNSKTELLQHQEGCDQARGRQKRNSEVMYVCGKCQTYMREKRARVEAHEATCPA